MLLYICILVILKFIYEVCLLRKVLVIDVGWVKFFVNVILLNFVGDIYK